jgi:signal transduction histidine kinase/CheY-like chemotaxis protein
MWRAASPTRLVWPSSARALLPAGIVTTLAIFLLAGAVVLDGRRDAAREAHQAADNVAAAMAQDIARNIELYDLSIQAVAHGLQFPSIATLEPDLRQMILFDRTANARHLGFINVLNEGGEVIADSRAKTPRSGNFASRDYFQFHRREPRDLLFIGRPFLTGPDQPATIPLSRRLSHPDGSFAGVVVGSMRLAYFRELFDRVNLGPHATIALLRDDGLLLMRLPFSQDDLGRTIPADSPFFTAVSSGVSRVEGVEAGDPARRSYTIRRVGDLPLLVSVGLADQDVFAPWLFKAALVMATVAALCLLLVWVIARLATSLARQAQAEEKARAANREMERFVETISHELRTPLTSIVGYAELLSWYGRLPPDHAGYAAAIVSAGNQMRHVLKRMLEVPRTAMPRSLPDLQDTDLDTLASTCCKEMELSAGRRGLRLGYHVAPDLPRSAVLDPVQVRQVLVNLLSNAIKYTTEGAVELRMSRTPGRLRFEVVDTGPGIPSAKQRRLFTAHDRLGAERGHIEGSGMGLWTVEMLVSGMQGKVGYADNPGGGSIFWVEIPSHARASVPVPAVSAITPPETPQQRTAKRPLRILLADDTALNRDLAGRFLRSAGHTVVEVNDGSAAVQAVTTADFDLVLLDIRMAGINGLEAARLIRGLGEPRGGVPIVAVTANSTPSHQDTYRKAGIDRHLAKPFTCEDLLRTVEAAVAEGTHAPAAGPACREPERAGPKCALPMLDRVVPDGVMPNGAVPNSAVLDVEVLEELASRMSANNIDAYLRTFAGRIDALLDLLKAPAGEELAEMVHEMKGSAGFLGFAALGAALHEYEAAEQAPFDQQSVRAAHLATVAEQARAALCGWLSVPGLAAAAQ